MKKFSVILVILFLTSSISLSALGEEYRQWVAVKSELESIANKLYQHVINSGEENVRGELKSNDGLIVASYDPEKDFGFILYLCSEYSSINVGFYEAMELLYDSPIRGIENGVYSVGWKYLGQFEFFDTAAFMNDTDKGYSGILLQFSSSSL